MIDIKVERLLPQKNPFVMVDSLFEFSETELSSGYTIRQSDIFIENGRFNEAGLIEHMAQSVALHTGYSFFLKQEAPPKGYIGSINKVEVFSLPKIGEQVKTKIEILQEFMGITLVTIDTFLNGVRIATGKMKTVLAND